MVKGPWPLRGARNTAKLGNWHPSTVNPSAWISIHTSVNRDSFIRYRGGGVGHGGNVTEVGTPAAPNADPDGLFD